MRTSHIHGWVTFSEFFQVRCPAVFDCPITDTQNCSEMSSVVGCSPLGCLRLFVYMNQKKRRMKVNSIQVVVYTSPMAYITELLRLDMAGNSRLECWSWLHPLKFHRQTLWSSKLKLPPNQAKFKTSPWAFLMAYSPGGLRGHSCSFS
jgi:hypothetical protein